MPVEIRELQIRVQVQGSQGAGEPASSAPTSRNGEEKTDWIAECLDQVFDIMESKKER